MQDAHDAAVGQNFGRLDDGPVELTALFVLQEHAYNRKESRQDQLTISKEATVYRPSCRSHTSSPAGTWRGACRQSGYGPR